MAWCPQATSHYLSQCWLKSLSPYGITRPQWVNSLVSGRCGCIIECVIFKHNWVIDISWYVITGLGNGLVLNRQQAITWISDGPVYQWHLSSLGCNDFMQPHWNPKSRIPAITPEHLKLQGWSIMWSCPEQCGPVEWTALETMKSIVILCLKSAADPPLRPPRITWLEGIVTSGRQQRNETLNEWQG